MGRILLDLGAHALDVHVEGLRVADVIGAPDAVDELVSGHHAPLVLHEVFEQFEFLEREEHAFAAHGDLMLANLHGDVAAHQRDVVVDHTAGLDRALIAPQDRADAREQLAERVGLGHVIVRADLQTDDFVDLGAFGGEHDDRHAALLADAPAQGRAVDARQHQVEQHQVDAALGEQLQALLTAGCGGDVVALARQLVHQGLTI